MYNIYMLCTDHVFENGGSLRTWDQLTTTLDKHKIFYFQKGFSLKSYSQPITIE
jgi:hypothetical protein